MMFKDIGSALNFVEHQRNKHSFQYFQDLVIRLGLEKQRAKIIHVSGTNGKGSTVKIITDLLVASGYQVGSYTSPYIIKHNERICLNNQPISDHDLLTYINRLYPLIREHKLAMFEIDTIIMLQYFQDKQPDYLVVECGIGGKEDKTNVLVGDVGVITNISYDHQMLLGNTLRDIADHKAGIIKPGQLVFSNETNPEVLAVIKKRAAKQQALLVTPKQDQFLIDQLRERDFPAYQKDNLNLGIWVVKSLIDLDSEIIRTCLDNFQMPGRFEKIANIILDGAHNPSGILALKEELTAYQDLGIVFAGLRDKNISRMLELLQDYDVIKATFDDQRVNEGGIPFKEAIAKMEAKHSLVVVTGSLHFVSAVRKYLMTKGA